MRLCVWACVYSCMYAPYIMPTYVGNINMLLSDDKVFCVVYVYTFTRRLFKNILHFDISTTATDKVNHTLAWSPIPRLQRMISLE